MSERAPTSLIRPAIVGGWFYAPYEAVGNEAAMRALKKRLTMFSRDGGKPISLYKDLPTQGYIGIPRAFGLLSFPWLAIEDQRTAGLPMIGPIVRLPSPDHPSVKEPELQRRFMNEMEAATNTEKSFMAEATTGSGKTVVGARNAAILGRKTAILVPLERLMGQWRKEIMDKLGVPEKLIGIVQSDTCEWRDRDYVLCMMKSLSQRRYEPDFYAAIGYVLVDECHRLGSPETANTVALFAAEYRQGLSATIERPDGKDKAIFWHIGPIKVRSQATAVACTVFVRDYDDGGRMASIPPLRQEEGKPRKSDHGFRIKKLSQDQDRNEMLAMLIYRMWVKGRKIFAVGEHIEHVQKVMELAIKLGIPREQCGQCTGDRITPTGKRVKISARQFNYDKENSTVIFATYGCFKLGLDEPRLDAGIELSPQAAWKQAGGRVRRPFTGKASAYWVSIRDTGDYLSMRYFSSRLRQWKADSQVTVQFNWK